MISSKKQFKDLGEALDRFKEALDAPVDSEDLLLIVQFIDLNFVLDYS